MAKIINAQAILREKGFVQTKFSTHKFMEDVAAFFMDNSVESRLLLVPFRFLDINRDSAGYWNPYCVTEEEEQQGYKAQTEKDSTGNPAWIREAIRESWELYREQEQAGLARFRFIIDRPFFENAAGLLRVMGGYVVERKMRKRMKTYEVTLI